MGFLFVLIDHFYLIVTLNSKTFFNSLFLPCKILIRNCLETREGQNQEKLISPEDFDNGKEKNKTRFSVFLEMGFKNETLEIWS